MILKEKNMTDFNSFFVKVFFNSSVLFLIGCAGSGTIESLNYEVEPGSLYDLNSIDVSSLELITVDGQTFKMKRSTGNFVRANGTASILLDQNSNDVAKSYPAKFPPQNLTSFVTIIAEGNSYDGNFGLVGLPNNSIINLANGSYVYKGNAEVFINDGAALYGLTGDAELQVQFDGSNSTVTGELNSLSGKKSFLDLSCRDCSVSEVLTIKFPSGSLCNGNRICLTAIDLTQSKLDSELSSSYELVSDGVFFGPESSEVGGIFSVKDTESGSIEIRGAFVGKR